jgi:hypothetical protein
VDKRKFCIPDNLPMYKVTMARTLKSIANDFTDLLYLNLPYELHTNCSSVILQPVQKPSVYTSGSITASTYSGQRSFKFKLPENALI